MKEYEKASYFIDPTHTPKITQMEGLETTILTGLHGEKVMMTINTTLPGHTVPLHSQARADRSMLIIYKQC